MAFNLDQLALKETATMDVRHPSTGEVLTDENGNKVSIEIYGTSSKVYRDAILKMHQRSMKRGKKSITPTEMREESTELLTQCSEAISNLSYQGAAVDNPEAFRALYSDYRFDWLRNQVDAFLGSTEDFLEV